MLLETDNLKVKNAVLSDAEFLATIQTNPIVQKHIGGVLGSFDDTLTSFKNQPITISNFYIVRLKSENIPIGVVSFLENSYLNDYEILIAFMPDYCGKNYGSETLSTVKDYWLNKNGVNHLFATVTPENTTSISMLKKEGFKFIKEYKEDFSPLQQVYKYQRNCI